MISHVAAIRDYHDDGEGHHDEAIEGESRTLVLYQI